MGVLEALALRPEGLSLSSLSRDLKLPKTSLFNLLRALEQDSYVINTQGSYRLGRAALRLGSMMQSGVPAWQRVGVLLPALATRCGEDSTLTCRLPGG